MTLSSHFVTDGATMSGKIEGVIEKFASRKLGVTALAVAGAAAANGAVAIALPISAIATAYIAGQAVLDTWGE